MTGISPMTMEQGAFLTLQLTIELAAAQDKAWSDKQMQECWVIEARQKQLSHLLYEANSPNAEVARVAAHSIALLVQGYPWTDGFEDSWAVGF